jgi:hypothetical protein
MLTNMSHCKYHSPCARKPFELQAHTSNCVIMLSSGLWRRVDSQVDTRVLEEHTPSIFKAEVQPRRPISTSSPSWELRISKLCSFCVSIFACQLTNCNIRESVEKLIDIKFLNKFHAFIYPEVNYCISKYRRWKSSSSASTQFPPSQPLYLRTILIFPAIYVSVSHVASWLEDLLLNVFISYFLHAREICCDYHITGNHQIIIISSSLLP